MTHQKLLLCKRLLIQLTFFNNFKHYFLPLFSLRIYKYLQHQYYHHQPKYHRHIRIIQSFSYNQLKTFSKHFLKIMELHFLRIFCFKLQCKLKQNFWYRSVKYIEFFFCSQHRIFYTCIGPLLRIFFFSLSACTDALISPPNILTFLPNPLPPDNQNLRVH